MRNTRLHRLAGRQSLAEMLARAAEGVVQLAREGSPPPGLRLPQAKLSRNSNQIAPARIRRFESDMPSHAVVSNRRSADVFDNDLLGVVAGATAMGVGFCGGTEPGQLNEETMSSAMAHKLIEHLSRWQCTYP